MKDCATASPRVEILRNWDASALQTPNIRNAHAAVLLWSEVSQVDGGPSPQVSKACASALVSLGPVGFRFEGSVPPAGVKSLGRVGNPRVKREVLLSEDPAVVQALFDGGDWAQGAQAAVAAVSIDRALRLLERPTLDSENLQGLEVVFAAVVDGGGAFVAARSETRLLDVLDRLCVSLRKADVQVVNI